MHACEIEQGYSDALFNLQQNNHISTVDGVHFSEVQSRASLIGLAILLHGTAPGALWLHMYVA